MIGHTWEEAMLRQPVELGTATWLLALMVSTSSLALADFRRVVARRARKPEKIGFLDFRPWRASNG